MSRLDRWFLPHEPDVVALLAEQARLTGAATRHFGSWARTGHDDDIERGRAVRHEAGRRRRELVDVLRTALSTPIDREDLYSISELFDVLLTGMKNVVREAQVLEFAPDLHVAFMAGHVSRAVEQLVQTVAHLIDDPDRASAAADEALHASHDLERAYREAMAELARATDATPVRVMVTHEVYRRLVDLADGIQLIANRAWYSVLKDR